MGAIYRREIGAFFSSPVGYVFLTVCYIISGIYFYNNTIASSTTDTSSFFTNIFMILLILIPLLTMKTFSEEKKEKTEQGLLTAPVGLTSVVLGKYFAALTIYTLSISIVWIYGIILSFFGKVAWATIFSNWLALIFLGCAYIAIGIFISSLTESQMVSAVITLVLILFSFTLDILAQNSSSGFLSKFFSAAAVQKVISALSFYMRYYEFTNGIFNLSSILFYLSTAVIFIFLTVRIFERRRWN